MAGRDVNVTRFLYMCIVAAYQLIFLAFLGSRNFRHFDPARCHPPPVPAMQDRTGRSAKDMDANEKSASERLLWADLIRVGALFAVVLLHAAAVPSLSPFGMGLFLSLLGLASWRRLRA